MNAETPLRARVTRRYSIPVGENGRMNLPADLRRRLGMKGAGKITIEEYEDRVELVSLEQRLARIDAIMAPYREPGVSWADELIADRRAEQAKEDAEDEAARLRRNG
jgi:AbrB family looped-hinge helix DNA binding protein